MNEISGLPFGRKQSYKVDDECFIYLGNHQGKRSKGKVIFILDLPDYSHPHYVIEIETSIDPLLEIRAAFTMWPEDSVAFEFNFEDDEDDYDD